jgi:DNA primase
MFSTAYLDKIRDTTDIVSLIGRYVSLEKDGPNFRGVCPFHAGVTPSFAVRPAKRVFHCFGCGVGGDVFWFIMRQQRLSFPEAVRALATLLRRRGVQL